LHGQVSPKRVDRPSANRGPEHRGYGLGRSRTPVATVVIVDPEQPPIPTTESLRQQWRVALLRRRVHQLGGAAIGNQLQDCAAHCGGNRAQTLGLGGGLLTFCLQVSPLGPAAASDGESDVRVVPSARRTGYGFPSLPGQSGFESNPDIDQVDAAVRFGTQTAVNDLARQRKLPIIGETRPGPYSASF
jgi:hypothetical protein